MTNINPAQLVDYIGHTSAVIEKSAAQLSAIGAEKKTQQAKIAALIPGVVEQLVQHGRIGEHQKTAAVSALSDHEKTLQILQRLASHRNEKEAAAMGQPVAETYGKSTSYAIGATPTDALRESDRRLFAAMGVSVG